MSAYRIVKYHDGWAVEDRRSGEVRTGFPDESDAWSWLGALPRDDDRTGSSDEGHEAAESR